MNEWDIWQSASTATDKLQPGSWQIPGNEVFGLVHRATGPAPARRACWVVSAHWLYFGRLFILITGLITSAGSFPASWGVKSLCCWKNDCLWSHPFHLGSLLLLSLLPPCPNKWLLLHHKAFCTSISLYPCVEWNRAERVPPCPHCADTERDTIIRQEGKMTFESEQMHPGPILCFI